MLDEFKKFAMRGNVIDLAVGFIIGGAFGGIVTSLVKDIIMPPKDGAATINYGAFINTVINFVIVALALFLLIRAVNRMTAKPTPPPAPAAKECPFCFSNIPVKATRCPNCTSQL